MTCETWGLCSRVASISKAKEPWVEFGAWVHGARCRCGKARQLWQEKTLDQGARNLALLDFLLAQLVGTCTAGVCRGMKGTYQD